MSKLLNRLTRINLDSRQVKEISVLAEAITSWPELLGQIELNALGPLVHQHVSQHALPVDEPTRLGLAALSMRHRAAADARYKTFADLAQRFSAANIPLVALKGLALAPLIYKTEGLRPMRDMDVLVPRDSLDDSAQLLREAGFELPDEQESRFMRDSHQLPNATKKVGGFTISVEVHHDALPREAAGHLYYEDVRDSLQTIHWREGEFQALGHELMLHQVCKHLSGLHPGDYIKQINMLDAVAYAETFMNDIDWSLVRKRYSHVINTLKCLHYVVPLSQDLQQQIDWSPQSAAPPGGVGTIMLALKRIYSSKHSLGQQARLIFHPSDWWMHLYYNVDPSNSLWWVKGVRHPLTVAGWLIKRAYSGAVGG